MIGSTCRTPRAGAKLESLEPPICFVTPEGLADSGPEGPLGTRNRREARPEDPSRWIHPSDQRPRIKSPMTIASEGLARFLKNF